MHGKPRPQVGSADGHRGGATLSVAPNRGAVHGWQGPRVSHTSKHQHTGEHQHKQTSRTLLFGGEAGLLQCPVNADGTLGQDDLAKLVPRVLRQQTLLGRLLLGGVARKVEWQHLFVDLVIFGVVDDQDDVVDGVTIVLQEAASGASCRVRSFLARVALLDFVQAGDGHGAEALLADKGQAVAVAVVQGVLGRVAVLEVVTRSHRVDDELALEQVPRRNDGISCAAAF